MAIATILLPLTDGAGAEAALDVALLAAMRWQAALRAVHVRADGREVMALAGEGLSGAMIEQMITAAEREASRRAAAAEALFTRMVAAAPIPVRAAFVTETGRAEDVAARQARLSDLTVLARPDLASELGGSDVLHAVLFDSGRPVLIAPPTPPARLGTRIALAWSGTAEAASAVWFGLPWLVAAEQVTILTAPDYQRRGPDAAGLVAYLAEHGVEAQAARFAPTAQGVGAGLLAAAGEMGADLLVMGAYSASRLRQMILGGVTRHVIEHAALPVLMSR